MFRSQKTNPPTQPPPPSGNSTSRPASDRISENRKILAVLAMILLVTIVPYLIWGSFLDEEIPKRLTSPEWTDRPWLSGLMLMGLLIADIFLPIPSSFVCTWSGALLGWVPGTLVNWTGLNLSAGVGYFLARQAVERLGVSTQSETNRPLGSSRWFLAFCRGLPVLAEGSVLWAGTRGWRIAEVWFPIVLGNLVLSGGYAALGFFALQAEWLGSAIVLATALPAVPLTAYLIWQFYFRNQNQKAKNNPENENEKI